MICKNTPGCHHVRLKLLNSPKMEESLDTCLVHIYLISSALLWRRKLRPLALGSFRIASAIVSRFGHVPHLIPAILRYFQISFSADLLMFFFQSFCFHAEGTMNEVVDPVHAISVSHCLSNGPILLFSTVLPPPINWLIW